MKVRAFNIDWDTDNVPVTCLPKTCYVDLDDDQDPKEDLADVLSDQFGFCVKGCQYEILS